MAAHLILATAAESDLPLVLLISFLAGIIAGLLAGFFFGLKWSKG